MSNENIRVLKCKIRGHMQHIDMMHFDDDTFWRRLGSSMYLSICPFVYFLHHLTVQGFCSFKVTLCKDAEVFGKPSLPSATRVIPPDLPSRRLADLSCPVIGLCWPIHREDRKNVHPSLLFSPPSVLLLLCKCVVVPMFSVSRRHGLNASYSPRGSWWSHLSPGREESVG